MKAITAKNFPRQNSELGRPDGLCGVALIRLIAQVFVFLAVACYAWPALGFQESSTTKNLPGESTPTQSLELDGAKPPIISTTSKKKSPKFDAVVINAFKKTHQGYSSDEVILNAELNDEFIKTCLANLAETEMPQATAFDLNWRLMNLRKAGKLNIKSTRSNRSSVDNVSHVAEIAARMMHDKHSISSDQVMADPARRAEFNEIVQSIDPNVDLYTARKAAFQLRKARRLRPELITRIADWGRVVETHSADSVAKSADLIPAHPGVYIFRDATGYLYIGQSDNLRDRLKSHLDESHNESLANYLGTKKLEQITIEVHSFEPDSQARKTMVRRAYESELIASRNPKFNLQP